MNKQYTTRRYTIEDYALWNQFVAKAKNATFLFHRDFMEYHSDRFEDYSLMIFDQKKLCAVIPANFKDQKVYTHQGLTYGGIVFLGNLKFSESLGIYKSALEFLLNNAIQHFVVKVLPRIYSTEGVDELDYLLFLTKSTLVRRDLTIAVDRSNEYKIQSNRMEGVKKGIKNQLQIRADQNFEAFWEELLVPHLKQRFQSTPTHSSKEIQQLASIFPENIRQYNVYHQEKLVAGATLFITDTVVHTQYISANDDKQQLGSLDFLFHYLIKEAYTDKRFFDLGTSSENAGRAVNKGLLYWKECFGGKGYAQDTYKVATENYTLLNEVL